MRPTPFAALLAVVVSLQSAHGQTRYVDDARHWQLEVPEGWVRSPNEVVDTLNAELDRRFPVRNFDFLAQFLPADPDGRSPYLLVQFTAEPLAGATYEQLEEVFGARAWERHARDTLNQAPDMVSNYNFTTPALDRATNRVYMDVNVKRPDGQQWKGRCVTYLGSQGSVQLNFYSPQETFAANLPQLDRFISGFWLDPAYAFQPAQAPPGPAQQGVIDRIGFWGFTAPVLVLGGLTAAVATMLFRKAKAARFCLTDREV